MIHKNQIWDLINDRVYNILKEKINDEMDDFFYDKYSATNFTKFYEIEDILSISFVSKTLDKVVEYEI